MIVPCKFEATAFWQENKTKQKTSECRYTRLAKSCFPLMPTASLRVVGHECHTPLHYDTSFTSFETAHTHTPSKAGLVQYASYTTKCPGTTSGLSGKQATHDGVHALPPVGTGPAHKKLFARPEEWRNTFRRQSSYTTSVQELSPPQASYATKRPGTGENHKTWHGTFAISWTCASLTERLEALPHSV